jgi:hypothetical protein
MPQAVPFVVAFFTSSAWYVVLARVILVNLALGALSKKLSKRGEALPPLNVTVRGTVEPRRLVFGTRRVGGVLAWYGTSSTDPTAETRDYLWYVIVVAGHQVSDIKDIWIDIERIADADIDSGTNEVTGKFAGKVKIWRHLGTGAQTVNTDLETAITEWTTDHRLRGCAYVVIRFQRDDGLFPGIPQSVTSLIDGALVYDQRLDSTNGGSGSHRQENPSTWAFSRNPALHLQWVLTGGSVVNDQSSRMIRYGLREPYSRVDSAYIVAAANECDEMLTGGVAPPSGSQTRYYCDLEVSCAEPRRDIVNAILSTMAGTAVMVHGKWRIYAGAYESPIHTVTQDDLHGDLEIQDTSSHTERYNAVCAVFVDAEQQYVEDTCQIRTDSAYEAQDGDEQILRELDLRGVTNQYQAQRLCEIELRKSRMQRTAKIIGSLNLLKCALYEGISYSHSRYGWTNRIFRVQERQFEPGEDAGRVSLTCVRDDPGVWADMLTGDYTTGTSFTDVFQSDAPDAPTSLTITAHPSFVVFTVGLPAYFAPGSFVEIWEHTSSTPFSSATRIAYSASNVVPLPKRDTTTRYYWARIRDPRGAVGATFPTMTGQSGVADTVAANGISHDPADGNTVYSSATQPTLEAAGINGYVEYTAPAGVSARVQASWSGQAQVSNTTSGVAVGYARIHARVFVNSVEIYSQDNNLEGCTTATANWGLLSGSRTFNIAGGDHIELFLQTGRNFSTGGSSPAQTITWRSAMANLLPLQG